MSATVHRATGAMRLLRAAALTAAMLMLTAVVHTQAHGDLPSAGTLLVLAVLVLALSALLLSRQRGYSTVIAFSVGTQALLHVLLTVGSGHGSHQASLMPSFSMIFTHAGAAVAMALVLARADALLHRWITMVHTALLCVFVIKLTTKTARTGAIAFVTTFLTGSDLEHAIHRRGPPAVICN